MDMNMIEARAKALAAARDELAERVLALKDEMEACKRRRLRGIKSALTRTQAAHDELHAAVASAPALFEKPKTRVLHGLRVGFMKQRGKIDFADAANLCDAIRRRFPDDADTLIKITERPIVAALANLPAKDLQRLGVTVTEDQDAVVIKPADGELEKLLSALVSNSELEALT